MGDRKKRKRSGRAGAADKPNLRNVKAWHLRSTEDLLILHDQAVVQGLIDGSEAGRIDFFCFAERARMRGHNPGGMLKWLLVNRKTEFITQAEEDAAVDRLREHRDGSRHAVGEGVRAAMAKPQKLELTDDGRFVRACLLAVKSNPRIDPFYVAQKAKGWPREQWDEKRNAYELRQVERWQDADGFFSVKRVGEKIVCPDTELDMIAPDKDRDLE